VVSVPAPPGSRRRPGYSVVKSDAKAEPKAGSSETSIRRSLIRLITRATYHGMPPTSMARILREWRPRTRFGSLISMDLMQAARDVEQLLEAEGRLIRLSSSARTVFVGDVHGDLDAVECVFTEAAPGTVIVFLGDVVDRGLSSREALTRILLAKLDRPQAVFLLMGNHEAWGAASFRPADFWESLSRKEVSALSPILLKLPFAAWHEAGVLGLHGALPDLPTLNHLATVAVPSPPWRDITWGDWSDSATSPENLTGRPTYGTSEFIARARRLGVRVLVRSHQPHAPTYLFEDRCLTLFTSRAYGGGPRRVAVLAPGRAVSTAHDLDVVEI